MLVNSVGYFFRFFAEIFPEQMSDCVKIRKYLAVRQADRKAALRYIGYMMGFIENYLGMLWNRILEFLPRRVLLFFAAVVPRAGLPGLNH